MRLDGPCLAFFVQRRIPAGAGRQSLCLWHAPNLSLSVLDAALDIFDGADLASLWAKAQALGDLFLEQTKAAGCKSISPAPGTPRGGHVSLKHEHGYAVVRALIERGVIGDFREPDIMRFGFSPLYLSYADVWRAADQFMGVLTTGAWRHPEFQRRRAVT